MNGIQDCRKLESARNANQPIGTEKKCPKCEETKPLESFYLDPRKDDGRRTSCKKCMYEKAKAYDKATPERKRRLGREYYHRHAAKASEYQKKRRIENHQLLLAKDARWRKNNKAKIAVSMRKWALAHPEEALERAYKWQMANPEKMKKARLKQYVKRQANPKMKLSVGISNNIRSSVCAGSKGQRHWETLVGYTTEKLMKHLERQFTKGMTWENYGPHWHIDHIIPVSAFNFSTPEDYDFKRCWALKNLQPLLKAENLRKNDKLTKPFQPGLMI